MSGSFLDFFANLQERQHAGPVPPRAPAVGSSLQNENAPNAAAQAAAAAAPPSRPAPRQNGAHAAPASPRRQEAPANNNNDDDTLTIPWAEVQAAASRLGPLLSALRSDQDQQPHNTHETYSMEHLKRLEMFKPLQPYLRPRANRLCSKSHPQPCAYSCKTCHFCRQRTTEIKTVCSMCEGVNNFYGGPARGYWCGSCLWLRIGENIDEVRDRADWICPGCRDVCNCSGANCMRIKRGWFPTNQLSHEAKDQGFRSVAHYLVTTHVSAAAAAAPIADTTSGGHHHHAVVRTAMSRQRAGGDVDELIPPPPKRQRTLNASFLLRNNNNSSNSREAALQRASTSKMEVELAAVMAEMGGTTKKTTATATTTSSSNSSMSALQQLLSTITAVSGGTTISSNRPPVHGNGNTNTTTTIGSTTTGPFLGILDVDVMDEEEEEEAAAIRQPPPPPPPASVSLPTAVMGRGGVQSPDVIDVLIGDDVLLPPRRPPRSVSRQAPVVAPAAALDDDDGRNNADGDAHLRRLVEGGDGRTDGDAGYDTRGGNSRYFEGGALHQGLPQGNGITNGDRMNNASSTRAPRALQLVVPGWGNGHARHHTTTAAAVVSMNNRIENQQQHNERAPSETHQSVPIEIEIQPNGEVDGDDDDGGVAVVQVQPTDPSMVVVVEEEEQQQQQHENVTIDLSTSQQQQQQQSSPSVPPINRIDTAMADALLPLPPPPPCTDAHTALLATTVATLTKDEFYWNDLYLRAARVVKSVHMLYKHHPDNPQYEGPLMGAEDDVIIYEAVYDASTSQLLAVLRSAEALTPDDVSIPPPPPSSSTASCSLHPSTMQTYPGLRRAVSLLTYLARLLPPADVQWRVERRLLGAEPFVNFNSSDVRARAILLKGRLELLATLYRRQLPINDTATSISTALACIARDMHAALPLLNAIIANQPLPEHDLTIGAWRYDAEARQRRFLELFGELSVLYASLMQVLTAGLQQITSLCTAIGLKAASFLTPELINALLGADVKLPGAVKRDALALVCTVLNVASPRHDDALALQLSPEERSVRGSIRRSTCVVLESVVVPVLEAMVQKDYHLWGSTTNQAWRSGGGTATATTATATTTICTSPQEQEGQAEHVGGEKVETLAQCYAFLISNHHLRWNWSAVEAKAAQPFVYSLFWRQANAAYRHFAVFLLAHTLAHAPEVLCIAEHAVSALKLWLQALMDTGRRQCAWYLTTVLSENAATRSLFAGLSAQSLDIRGDVGGEKRAVLVGAVASNMVSSSVWRPQLDKVVGDVDAMLAARKKEIADIAFDPGAAVLRWEGVTSKTLLALLRSLVSVVGSTTTTTHTSVLNGGRVMAARDAAAWPQLMRLLNRVATWMVSSCAYVHASYHSNSALSHSDGGGGDYDDSVIKTVADARGQLQATAFGGLPLLFDILLAAGAPAVFDTNGGGGGGGGVLECLWIVIAGCIELGSGEVDATPVDTAVFQLLSDSLLPTSQTTTTTSSHHHHHHHHLCCYVVSTFIKRYLQRSSLRHASNERAAVNAMRLVRSVLSQPSMRSSTALNSVVTVLLRPLLTVLNPEGKGVQPSSQGTKAIVYTVLCELVKAHPSLLPPLHPPPPQSHSFDTALHAFWMAVCRDALHCVSSRLMPSLAEERLRTAVLAVRRRGSSSNPVLLLWPTTEDTVAQASNALMGALGRQRSVEAVEKLFNRPGGTALLSPCMAPPGSSNGALVTSGGGTTTTSTTTTNATTANGVFRPGDFPWKVAAAAIDLLRTLASLSCSHDATATTTTIDPAHVNEEEHHQRQQQQQQQQRGNNNVGAQWAAACFPALHHLIPGAGQASTLLHGSYRTMRTALEGALGPESTAAYSVITTTTTVPTVPTAQEQREPNAAVATDTVTAVSAAAAAPPPCSFPRAPQHRPQSCSANAAAAAVNISTADVTLSALAALPLESIAPITVLIEKVKCKVMKDGSQAAVCVVKDLSGGGGGGAEVSARLGAAASAAVSSLLSLNMHGNNSNSPTTLPVVRFSQVRLAKRVSSGGDGGAAYICSLTTLASTVVEIDPQGRAADALRRSQRQPPPNNRSALPEAASQQGDWPGFDASNGYQHGVQSQTTQPAAAPPPPPPVVKLEKSNSSLGVNDLRAVHSKLVEMGYSSDAASTAVREVMRETGGRWKQMSVEQVIDASVQKLASLS